ncbi:MAG: DUF5060 domain-containing protein [Planctomycetota bacterium]
MLFRRPTALWMRLLFVWAIVPGGFAESETVTISEAPLQWHAVTLSLEGPHADEADTSPNPFTELRFDVVFEHASGEPSYVVPGYFAADGNAAETSATSGNVWRAHLSPDLPGTWHYVTRFRRLTLDANGHEVSAEALKDYDGLTGSFAVGPTDKTGRDFRAKGRLQYVGGHYLRFAGDGSHFLKVGADAPETLLAYSDFDDTFTLRDWVPTRDYEPHLQDWRPGDPTWQDGKGRGLIGALNYLSAAGANGISFIPYNIAGDGRNVWPMISPDLKHKLHYDCSKLDQWGIVLAHAQTLGLHLNFKLQETENDDNTMPDYEENPPPTIPASLDGGDLGPERRLYLRELIARYGHHLALTWNLGEENSQTPQQQRAMAEFILGTDPYDHLIVVQTFPHEQDKVYRPLLGERSVLTGAALQNDWDRAHELTLKWVRASAEAGRPWVVCNDEQNHWTVGVPPDSDYPGYNGTMKDGSPVAYDEHDIRKQTLWGNLMAGGGGVEYYFGWELIQGDLFANDWRSRENSWRFGRIAIDFFHDHGVPFWAMTNRNAWIGNPGSRNGRFCLGPTDEQAATPIVVYVADGSQSVAINTPNAGPDGYRVAWFNPREGGDLQAGSVEHIAAGQEVSLGQPPADPEEDWVILLTPESDTGDQ